MRFSFFSDLLQDLNYKHLLHTHSHIAFLGWVYSTLFMLITSQFLNKDLIEKGKYKTQFFTTQLIIAGMFISFLLQGYGVVSIIFSTIFQFLTYWFSFSFFKSIKNVEKNNISIKFIKVSLISLVISSLGTWGLAIINAKGLEHSELYNMAIYFYLHFQYNGWFTFAIFGLLFKLLEDNDIKYDRNNSNTFFRIFTLSLIPSYLLSLIGINIQNSLYYLALVSVVLQLISCAYFINIIYKIRYELSNIFNNCIKVLFLVSMSSFLSKNVLQAFSTIPSLNNIVFHNRYIVISYIHLVLIGFITMFLISYSSYLNWFDLKSTVSKIGITSLTIGFISSEILITLFGLSIIFNDLMLFIFIFSSFMMLGLFLIFIAQFKYIKSTNLSLKMPLIK